MLYKIMSAVSVRTLPDGRIVSGTQALLEDGILNDSPFMDDGVKNKIKKANLAINKNSVFGDGLCRGDIYVETSDKLTLPEQRKLVDGMTLISSNADAMVNPVVIRSSPNETPVPVERDTEKGTVNLKTVDYPFVAVSVPLFFPNDRVDDAIIKEEIKKSYSGAGDIAKSLNREMNHYGYTAVFADMSQCTRLQPVTRQCDVILQKTSKFKDKNAEFPMEPFLRAFSESQKLKGAIPGRPDIVPCSSSRALIGSLSLENAQFAASRRRTYAYFDQDVHAQMAKNLLFDANPLFMNGSGREEGILFTDKAKPSPMESFGKYESSTEQDLSANWRRVPSVAIMAIGKENEMRALAGFTDDICTIINEEYGYGEGSSSLVKSVLSCPPVSAGAGNEGRLFMFSLNGGVINRSLFSDIRDSVHNGFSHAAAECPGVYGITTSIMPVPILSDIKFAKEYMESVKEAHVPLPRKETAAVLDSSLTGPFMEKEINKNDLHADGIGM